MPSRNRLVALATALTALACASPASAALPDLRQEPPFKLGTRTEGNKQFLGFGSAVRNIGPGPLIIEASRADQNNPRMIGAQIEQNPDGSEARRYAGAGSFQYFYGGGHEHWHLDKFDQYELRSGTNFKLVGPGTKAGFCLGQYSFDKFCGRGRPDLTSIRVGTPVNYTDDYPPFLEGQEIEITDLATGRYCLVHEANSDGSLRETNYRNNQSSVLVSLTRDSRGRMRVGVIQTWPRSGECGLLSRRDAAGFVRRAVTAELGSRPRSLRRTCRRRTLTRLVCGVRFKGKGGQRYKGKATIYYTIVNRRAHWNYSLSAKTPSGRRIRGREDGGSVNIPARKGEASASIARAKRMNASIAKNAARPAARRLICWFGGPAS